MLLFTYKVNVLVSPKFWHLERSCYKNLFAGYCFDANFSKYKIA